MKKTTYILFAAVFALSLCSCSSTENNEVQQDCIGLWGSTWYEDGMFYERHNSDGESVLCYYSKDSDSSAVMCGLPECTHSSKTSPNCGALCDSNTYSRCGYNRIGTKLYFIAEQNVDRDTMGSVDLIECDIDGKNRRVIASMENTNLPFITDVQYSDDHILITYYQNFDFVENENTGENEFVYLDKHRFYIKRIEISTGNIETLVYREEYSGMGSGTVYGNILYYTLNYYATEVSGDEPLTPETAPPRQCEFCIRDLSTGEEKVYKDMAGYSPVFCNFSPDRIIVCDRKTGKLCRFNSETEAFTDIADFNQGSYTEDGTDALFLPSGDAEFMIRYNFESGEISQIPFSKDKDIYPSLTHIVGNTAWTTFNNPDGDLLNAYIDRDDFFEGKFENFKIIKEAELQ